MQNYTEVALTQTIKNSLSLLLNNDKTALSCSSGTTFPTTNLQVGMLCFRTDQNMLYELANAAPTWVLIADLNNALPKNTGLPSGVDLNTVTTSGFYRLGEFGTNSPSAAAWGQLIVCHGGGDTITQLYGDHANGDLWSRSGNPSEVSGAGSWTPWRKLWHDGNDGAGSGMDADLLDGMHAASMVPLQSVRDFTNGTLIQTNIDYSVSAGISWLLEITGNAYNEKIPFDISVQGYIYDNAIIAHGGISNGTYINGLVALNYNGNLCFWFPRQSYWHGYTVSVYNSSAAGLTSNLVTSVTNAAKPAGATKEVVLTTNLSQSLHSANYSTYAVALTGAQTVAGEKTFSNRIYAEGGLTVGGGALSSTIAMGDADEGARSIHCNSDRIGFLKQGGDWGAYCRDDGSWASDTAMFAPIYYDSNDNSYYCDPNGTSRLNGITANAIDSTGTVRAIGGSYTYLSSLGSSYYVKNWVNSNGCPATKYFFSGVREWDIYINTDGLFGIWRDGLAARVWYVDGSGNSLSAGNVIAYSDERVKTNWRDVGEGFIAQLAQVKSGIYDRTDVDLTQVGVSAQSLQKVLPEAVLADSEGNLSVAYGNAALAACVELSKAVVALQARVEQLETELSEQGK